MNNYTVLRRYCDIIITHASRAKQHSTTFFSLSSTRIPLYHHEICFKAFNIFLLPTPPPHFLPNCRKTLFREMIPRFRFFHAHGKKGSFLRWGRGKGGWMLWVHVLFVHPMKSFWFILLMMSVLKLIVHIYFWFFSAVHVTAPVSWVIINIILLPLSSFPLHNDGSVGDFFFYLNL